MRTASKNIAIVLGLSIHWLCISCSQSKSNQVEIKTPIIDVEVTPQTPTTVDVEENNKATFVGVLRNFNKYRDVMHLFEGFEDIIYSPDTLMVFNFEKGTFNVGKISHEPIESCYEDMGFIWDAIRGDFQGDGWKDTLTVKHQNTDKGVFTHFVFSDQTIPVFVLRGRYYAKNEGDLNGDGGDEIGVLEAWSANQCTQRYRLFTIKDNQWVNLVDNVTVIEAMIEAGMHPVAKFAKQEGVILVRSATIGDCPKPPYIVERCIRLYTPNANNDSSVWKSFNDIRFGNWTENDWYDNDYFRFLRKCFDDCLKGVESENTINLQDYKSELNSKFFVFEAEPYIGGGMFITLGFLENPGKLYQTAIYSVVNSDGTISEYSLRGFRAKDETWDITKEEILQLKEEHPENKLW